ncbi:MAG TPA: hypothetical protein VHL31_12940 [Geminicoccus sp.]|uniref:hypothetical protein n=1 Tax=Geminicoccus sp. TaxID=2024832 RepID=UPI002E3392C1|nr:hypothetical protein [Geminicoccus sp.]HEX2527187.1 hypothetical protein [Geminicoccus sp.]
MQFGQMLGRLIGSEPAGAAAQDHGPAGQPFALYPPRTDRGLDPTRWDMFAARIADLRKLHLLQSEQRTHGCLQILDLEQIRLRFGRRWMDVREKAFQLIEHALDKGLGEDDFYLLASETRLYLLCTGAPRRDADLRARLIAAAITERLCGVIPGGVAVRVKSLAVDMEVLLADVVNLHTLEERIEAAMQAADRAEKEAFAALRASLAPSWQPVLSPRRGMVGAYRLDPVISGEGMPVCSLQHHHPGTVNGVFDAEMDGWAVETACSALPDTVARGRKALLVVPVHYETLASIALRDPFCLACRKLPKASARRLLFEVHDLPGGLVQARVRELMAYLRPFCVGILVRLDGAYTDHLAGTGIVGVSMVDPSPDDPSQAALAREFALSARLHGLRSYLFEAISPATCQRAARAGIDYLAGSGFMPSLHRPGPAILSHPPPRA